MHSAVEVRIFNSCCCSCDKGSDDFQRPNAGNIDTNSPFGWTAISGGATLSGNKAVYTDSNAIELFGLSHSDGYVKVRTKITHSASGKPARLYLGYVSTTNFLAVEIERRSTSIYDVRIVDGSGSVLAEHLRAFANTALTYTIEICVTTHGQLVWRASDLSFPQPPATGAFDVVVPSSGTVGMGTGSLSTGSVTFDDFVLEAPNIGSSCLCKTGLACCQAGVYYPLNCRITLSGIANGTCGNATDLNGNWDLVFSASSENSAPPGGIVTYQASISPAICDIDRVEVTINGTAAQFVIQFYKLTFSPAFQFRGTTNGCLNATATFYNDLVNELDASSSIVSVLFY